MYGHKYYQPPFNPSDESVEGLRVALERVAGRPISTEYARESTYNLIRFFEVLQRWDAETPGRVENIARSLRNVSPSQLADPDLFDFAGLTPDTLLSLVDETPGGPTLTSVS